MINKRCDKDGCRRLLLKVTEDFKGGLEIVCPKCGKINTFKSVPPARLTAPPTVAAR